MLKELIKIKETCVNAEDVSAGDKNFMPADYFCSDFKIVDWWNPNYSPSDFHTAEEAAQFLTSLGRRND